MSSYPLIHLFKSTDFHESYVLELFQLTLLLQDSMWPWQARELLRYVLALHLYLNKELLKSKYGKTLLI
jgi:hypothetical protein